MDNSWVSEVIVQFSNSPVWRTPVDNFVDEYCYMFDNETEMKLEYTAVHKEFVTLIDTLLTNFIGELGISLEEAMEELHTELARKETEIGGQINRFVSYLFAASDFVSFHRMMRRRNIELDILAMSALKDQGIDVSSMQEQEDLALFHLQNLRNAAMRENAGYQEEEALRVAIEESLKEQGAYSKLLELEDAELQEALAMSVRMEQEKAKVQRKAVANEVALMAKKDPTAAAKMNEEKTAVIEQTMTQNVKALEDKTLRMREQKVREVVGSLNVQEVLLPQARRDVTMEGVDSSAIPASLMTTMRAPSCFIGKSATSELQSPPANNGKTLTNSLSAPGVQPLAYSIGKGATSELHSPPANNGKTLTHSLSAPAVEPLAYSIGKGATSELQSAPANNGKVLTNSLSAPGVQPLAYSIGKSATSDLQSAPANNGKILTNSLSAPAVEPLAYSIGKGATSELQSAPANKGKVVTNSLSAPAIEPLPYSIGKGATSELQSAPANAGGVFTASLSAPGKAIPVPLKAPPAFADKLGFKQLPSLPSLPTQNQVPLTVLKAKVQAESQPSVETTHLEHEVRKPAKEELEERARYMRAQREKILERNKSTRQKELQNYATANSIPVNVVSHTTLDAEKQLTVDIARRLRGDILGEVHK